MSLAAALLLVAASGATVFASGQGSVGVFEGAKNNWQPPQLRYVALGDSVAAGLGLPPSANPSGEDTVCGRSPSAYANGVASAINDELGRFHLQMSLTNAACQGATMDNLLNPQMRGGDTLKPQLDAAFAQGAPTLLTLTMGANDAHWADFIGACFSAANCNTPENTALADSYIQAMKTKLSAALKDIRERSSFILPAIVVTGYYNPISAQCVNPNLSSGEATWVQNETVSLNNALQTASEQVGWFVRFAPVDFSGHDICSSDSWVQRPGVPTEPAPFHPTARGQQAMADAVLASLGVR